MPKRRPKPPPTRKPKPPDAATIAAKLKRLDALRKQARALAGPPAPEPEAKPKRRPRFSGNWGCG